MVLFSCSPRSTLINTVSGLLPDGSKYDLKELFVGYAEKEGIGTRLKTYLDSLDSLDGLLTAYEDKLNASIDSLNDYYKTASDKLDEKYEQMSTQFAQYTVLITQMENSFSSLKMIIEGDSSD